MLLRRNTYISLCDLLFWSKLYIELIPSNLFQQKSQHTLFKIFKRNIIPRMSLRFQQKIKLIRSSKKNIRLNNSLCSLPLKQSCISTWTEKQRYNIHVKESITKDWHFQIFPILMDIFYRLYFYTDAENKRWYPFFFFITQRRKSSDVILLS